jgi:uncharacterized protein YndB with AHSA1/START domain
MPSTRVTRRIAAPPEEVFAAILEPARWKFPAGMTCEVHEHEAREGGRIHVSLTYDTPDAAGKTTSHTDTYRGRYVEIVPYERIVEVDRFDTADPALEGEMRITIALERCEGGTEVTGTHEGLPPGVPVADNELGWREALDRLASLLER